MDSWPSGCLVPQRKTARPSQLAAAVLITTFRSGSPSVSANPFSAAIMALRSGRTACVRACRLRRRSRRLQDSALLALGSALYGANDSMRPFLDSDDEPAAQFRGRPAYPYRRIADKNGVCPSGLIITLHCVSGDLFEDGVAWQAEYRIVRHVQIAAANVAAIDGSGQGTSAITSGAPSVLNSAAFISTTGASWRHAHG